MTGTRQSSRKFKNTISAPRGFQAVVRHRHLQYSSRGPIARCVPWAVEAGKKRPGLLGDVREGSSKQEAAFDLAWTAGAGLVRKQGGGNSRSWGISPNW